MMSYQLWDDLEQILPAIGHMKLADVILKPAEAKLRVVGD